MTDNTILASHLLYRNLGSLQFPIRGRVLITDNRTSCAGSPGPCRVDISFSLELVQFEIPCPGDILRFTSSEHASIKWTEPAVRKLSGVPRSLSGSSYPGLHMTLGSTLVEYFYSMHPSQNPATRVTCNFTVWGSHAFVRLLVSLLLYDLVD
jgi:hypothetical protein